MLICWLVPKVKFKSWKIGKWIPASLIAIILTTIFEHFVSRNILGIKTRIVAETAAIQGGWPEGNVPENSNW